MRKLIKYGKLIDAQGETYQDILIEQGIICQVAPDIPPTPDIDVIDAKGLYVMPGGIDVHTHFNIDVGIATSCDDFLSGTIAAACGGTTTIIDHMGFGPKGCNLHHQLAYYHQLAAGKAVIDYSFHGVIQHINDDILNEIPLMVEEGVSSFKFYLTYNYKLDDEAILSLLTALKQAKALATVHPENDAIINFLRKKLKQEGKLSPIHHAISRPVVCEAEAIARVISLAEVANNAPLYIVHLSSGLGLEYINLAKKKGQSVWVETCPQYLLLDINHYFREDGIKYILSPPLRHQTEVDKLWVGISEGMIDVIATDHCSFPYQQRLAMARNDFTLCPNGLPGVENRMMLLFSYGVMTGRISCSRFVELTSANPAKLFGLWPKKGNLNVGSDADLVLFDPKVTTTITHTKLHDNLDYSPYEGIVCHGTPMMTLSRGEIVSLHGQFVGKIGHGQFLRRLPSSED